MDSWWPALVQWLHTIGLHVDSERVNAASQAAGQMDTASLAALAAALAWTSGLRLYAVVFCTGLAGLAGWVQLPPALLVLQHPAVLATSGLMTFVEFFADKIPWVDSLWDTANAFIRIPGGALLAAGALGADSATMTVVAALLGGSLAATAFATKASSRAALNTLPEPFTNSGASLLEDGLVVAALWLAFEHPVLFGLALAVVLLLSIILLVLLWRFLHLILRRLRGRPIPAGKASPE